MITLVIERNHDAADGALLYDVRLCSPATQAAHRTRPPSHWSKTVSDSLEGLENDLDPSRTPRSRRWRHAGRALWRYFFEEKGKLLAVGEALERLPGSMELWGSTMVLTSPCAEVLAQPWEYLLDSQGTFVFRDRRLGLIRSTGQGGPRPPAVPPLKVLVILSCPADRPGFNTLWCKQVVETQWKEVCGPYAHFEVEGLAPTQDTFLQALRDYDVVYFLGHGEPGDNQREPSLVLCQEVSESPTLAGSLLAAPEIAARIAEPNCRTKLLVLSACHSAQVAARILAMRSAATGRQLPTILCMQFPCPVGTALHFHKVVFPGLLFGYEPSIAGAVAKWRCRQDIARVPCTRDHAVWGVPTVFAPVGRNAPERELLEADRLVRTTALVAAPDGSATVGPIGLSPQQRDAVLKRAARLPANHLPLRQALGAAFASANPLIPYRPGVRVEPFEIDVYPVTNHLYDYYREHIRPNAPDRLRYQGEKPEHPARVSYEAARLYCQALEGRLPTRVEWERAARGASDSIFPWGDQLNAGWEAPGGGLRCNVEEALLFSPSSVFDACREVTWNGTPVCDMIGNVPEWTCEQNTMGWVAVMGAGYERPLVCNVPSFSQFVNPANAFFGFRCVWPQGDERPA